MPNALDLAVMTVLAQQKDKREALYLIREVAEQQLETEHDDEEISSYQHVTQIVLSLLYVNGDKSVPDAPATTIEALELFRQAKDEVASRNNN